MALSSALIQRLPVSTAAIYLGVGCALGPWGFGVLRIDLSDSAPVDERSDGDRGDSVSVHRRSAVALPLRHPAWRAAFRLASVVMIASIAGVAVCAWLVLDINPALALLLGAILAPTDPVLASSVTVGHSQDKDRLRYALSGEAGLNDGAAFPFVVLGLLLLGPVSMSEIASWAGVRLLGGACRPAPRLRTGRLVGTAAIALRTRNRDTAAPTDFLALALIALSYRALMRLAHGDSLRFSRRASACVTPKFSP